MLAFKFEATENPPVGKVAFVAWKNYGVIAADHTAALIIAKSSGPQGRTLLLTGETFDPPKGWKPGKLYPFGDV